jgi:hypothetical protein
MTKGEINDIAWILLKIVEVKMSGSGVYGPAAELAQAAIEVVEDMEDKFPRIRKAIERLKDN